MLQTIPTKYNTDLSVLSCCCSASTCVDISLDLCISVIFVISDKMVSATHRSFRQAWASVQQLCRTLHALQDNGLPQPNIGHSVGLQSIVESNGNMQQNHAPSFLVHRCSPVHVSRSQLPPGRLRGQLELQNMNVNDKNRLPRPQRFDPLHFQLSMDNARRLARLVQLDALKTRLQEIQQDSISYEELLCICLDSTCVSSQKEARRVARSLDESGDILILGRAVYLHPHKVPNSFLSVLFGDCYFHGYLILYFSLDPGSAIAVFMDT